MFSFKNDESYNQKSLHVFDSTGGLRYGDGFQFGYTRSLSGIRSFRIAGICLTTIPGPLSTSPIYYVYSNLSRAQYAGHINGLPGSLVSAVLNDGNVSALKWNYPINSCSDIDNDTITNIYFEIRDRNRNVIFPEFIILVEFTHCFK